MVAFPWFIFVLSYLFILNFPYSFDCLLEVFWALFSHIKISGIQEHSQLIFEMDTQTRFCEGTNQKISPGSSWQNPNNCDIHIYISIQLNPSTLMLYSLKQPHFGVLNITHRNYQSWWFMMNYFLSSQLNHS